MTLFFQSLGSALDQGLPSSAIFFLIAAAALVSVGWGAVASSAWMADPMRRRLRRLGEEPGVASRAADASRQAFEPIGIKGRSADESEGLQLRLIQAGLRSPRAVPVFHAAKLVLALLLPTLVAIAFLRAPGLSLGLAGTMVLLAMFAGHRLPDAYVERRRRERGERLMASFPDALDMLVACTEAGLSFGSALERVTEKLPMSDPVLSGELGQVNAEIRAGIDRPTALRNLADRTGLKEIRGLTSLIAHATMVGSGIAGTLRVYAEELRDRRMQRAEELAAKVGTKLIFPLCFCIFPCFFIVATGPAVIGVIKVMSGTGMGAP